VSTFHISEEEAEELYENILNLYQTKVNELHIKNEDMELKTRELQIALENKESELLDSQISGTQTSSSLGDETSRETRRLDH